MYERALSATDRVRPLLKEVRAVLAASVASIDNAIAALDAMEQSALGFDQDEDPPEDAKPSELALVSKALESALDALRAAAPPVRRPAFPLDLAELRRLLATYDPDYDGGTKDQGTAPDPQ